MIPYNFEDGIFDYKKLSIMLRQYWLGLKAQKLAMFNLIPILVKR